MRLYHCFYKGRCIELTAESSYAAQQRAQELFKSKRGWDITVVLADEAVDTASIG